MTPQFRRALLAMARMAEGIAEAARLLAASEDTEAEDTLLAVTRELGELRGPDVLRRN